MTQIQTELEELKKEFASLKDGFARYSYLVEISALLPKEEGIRDDRWLYNGCQSRVWLKVREEDGKCRIAADSDTLIIRGILYLLADLLDGRNSQEVLEADFDLLQDLSIGDQFSSERVLGISGLLPEIKKRLKQAAK